jgi:hydrogenase maturation protease
MPGTKSILIVGIGNYYYHDDAVGLYIAGKLKSLNLHDVKVIDSVPDCSHLIETWTGIGKVIVIDAAKSGAEPGHIYRFDALKDSIPEECFARYSTHMMSIVETIELAKTLGELPEKLIVYGIEGGEFSAGEGLTDTIKVAADDVIGRIIAELNE